MSLVQHTNKKNFKFLKFIRFTIHAVDSPRSLYELSKCTSSPIVGHLTNDILKWVQQQTAKTESINTYITNITITKSWLYWMTRPFHWLNITMTTSSQSSILHTLHHNLAYLRTYIDVFIINRSINQSIKVFLEWPKWHSHCKVHCGCKMSVTKAWKWLAEQMSFQLYFYDY